MSKAETEIVTLSTAIQRIIHESDGFIIAKTTDGDTIQGNIHHKGEELKKTDIDFEGVWKTHEKYGKGFHFKNYTIKENMDLWFLTRMIKGIPRKVAIDILSKTKSLGYLIENEPRSLLSQRGIGEKKLTLIIDTYNKNKPLQDLSAVLLPFGISPSKIRQIYEYYKTKDENAISEIKKNPYVLTKMDGIGFRRADELALKMNTDISSGFRIQSGIEFAIKDYSSKGGHTYCYLDDLYELSRGVLNIESIKVEADASKADGLHETEKKTLHYELSKEEFLVEIEILKDSGRMVTIGNDPQKVSIPYIAKAEEYIHEVLVKYAFQERSPLLSDVEEFILRAEEANGFRFGKQQKEAIRLGSLDYPITYLFGLAGSGKTTVSKALTDMYAIHYDADKIRCCSLSGVASARSQSVTGYEGSTIHSLLKFKGGSGGFEYNEDNKLPHRLILLDESSMTDSYLFASLLRAIDFERTSLIMVGDYAQLPSIGSGQVFKDIIERGYCRGTELDEVFRQSSDQVINVFATDYIRKGLVPEGYKNNSYEDFFFYPVEIENQWAIKKKSTDAEWKEIREENNHRITETVENIARSHVGVRNLYEQKKIKEYLSSFQVISPQKKGVCGVYELNKRIQSILNPTEYSSMLKLYGKTFKPRDKVIHLDNTTKKVCTKEVYKAHRSKISSVLDTNHVSERKVFNGEIGVILDIFLDDDNDCIPVYYPNNEDIVFYTLNDFDVNMIDLAYCLSVHKSQGSEFNNVVMLFTSSHFTMLSNELTYTGITRAKERMYIVGESFAFEKGCKQVSGSDRKTILSLYEDGTIEV